jgi:chromosome segregation ATPase
VQAAQRLHKSRGAIRQMALRGQLQRVRGNDGKARVLILPDMERAADVQAEQIDERPERVLSGRPERALSVQRTDGALTHALESHIKTLQADNEALKQELTTTRADLSAHVETLKGELEILKNSSSDLRQTQRPALDDSASRQSRSEVFPFESIPTIRGS